MKTVVTKKIESASDSVELGYWDNEMDEFVSFNGKTPEEIAEVLKCSPVLADTLVLLASGIHDALTQDLTDIWKRLDQMEKHLHTH